MLHKFLEELDQKYIGLDLFDLKVEIYLSFLALKSTYYDFRVIIDLNLF